MVVYLLLALAAGTAAGFSGKWQAVVVALLAPLPFYSGVAVGLYGNGFGENCQYAIPLWVGPVLFGSAAGLVVAHLKVRQRDSDRG